MRWKLIIVMLACISVLAPAAKRFIPEYSSEDLLSESVSAGLFASLIDNYAYFIAYPLKYLALIPLRAYSVLIGSDRAGDPMEAIVSLASAGSVVLGAVMLLRRRHVSPTALRLVILGFVAPIPIMWTEIMHWRYYSFVYFFFLFAATLHFMEPKSAVFARRVAHA